jgi:hypothetical protein
MCTGSHPFIPAENTAVVKMVFQTDGGEALNVLHFSNPSGWASSSLLDLALAVDQAWEDNVRLLVAPTVLLKEVTAQDVSVDEGAGNSVTVLAAGTNASAALPDNCTLAISFRTGFAGRSRRGRLYHVGMTEAQAVGDKLAAGAQAVFLTAYETMFSDIAAAVPDTLHVIVSYCHDGAWRADALVTPVNGYIVDDTMDSMRKRLSGRGR